MRINKIKTKSDTKQMMNSFNNIELNALLNISDTNYSKTTLLSHQSSKLKESNLDSNIVNNNDNNMICCININTVKQSLNQKLRNMVKQQNELNNEIIMLQQNLNDLNTNGISISNNKNSNLIYPNNNTALSIIEKQSLIVTSLINIGFEYDYILDAILISTKHSGVDGNRISIIENKNTKEDIEHADNNYNIRKNEIKSSKDNSNTQVKENNSLKKLFNGFRQKLSKTKDNERSDINNNEDIIDSPPTNNNYITINKPYINKSHKSNTSSLTNKKYIDSCSGSTNKVNLSTENNKENLTTIYELFDTEFDNGTENNLSISKQNNKDKDKDIRDNKNIKENYNNDNLYIVDYSNNANNGKIIDNDKENKGNKDINAIKKLNSHFSMSNLHSSCNDSGANNLNLFMNLVKEVNKEIDSALNDNINTRNRQLNKSKSTGTYYVSNKINLNTQKPYSLNINDKKENSNHKNLCNSKYSNIKENNYKNDTINSAYTGNNSSLFSKFHQLQDTNNDLKTNYQEMLSLINIKEIKAELNRKIRTKSLVKKDNAYNNHSNLSTYNNNQNINIRNYSYSTGKNKIKKTYSQNKKNKANIYRNNNNNYASQYLNANTIISNSSKPTSKQESFNNNNNFNNITTDFSNYTLSTFGNNNNINHSNIVYSEFNNNLNNNGISNSKNIIQISNYHINNSNNNNISIPLKVVIESKEDVDVKNINNEKIEDDIYHEDSVSNGNGNACSNNYKNNYNNTSIKQSFKYFYSKAQVNQYSYSHNNPNYKAKALKNIKEIRMIGNNNNISTVSNINTNKYSNSHSLRNKASSNINTTDNNAYNDSFSYNIKNYAKNNSNNTSKHTIISKQNCYNNKTKQIRKLSNNKSQEWCLEDNANLHQYNNNEIFEIDEERC